MSFKGTNLRLINEDFSKGINGVAAISDIPDGYVLEAENVDLGEPGKVKRRAGYNLQSCRLPVRTKRAELAAGFGDKVFELDAVRTNQLTLNIYKNTGLNATALADSRFYQVDDHTNTCFVKVVWPGFVVGFTEVPAITTESIIQLVQTAGVATGIHSYRPIVVYDDGVLSGTAKFLLPVQIFESTNPGISDAVSTDFTAYLCDAFTFDRLPVADITSIVLGAVLPTIATVTFVAGSALADLPLNTIVNFETCLHHAVVNNRIGCSGIVTAKTATTLSIQIETVNEPAGAISLTNLSIMYTTAKHFMYISSSESRRIQTIGSVISAGTQKIHIDDCVRIRSNQDSTAIGTTGILTTGGVDEIGFLYGTEIDVGYVNALNKYYDAEAGFERLICGYRGNFFVEVDVAKRINTVVSLKYAGVTTVIAAANDIFTIPLTGAIYVYLPGDLVTLQYATDWLGTTVSKTYVVSSATAGNLLLKAAGDTRLTVKASTVFKLKRTSSRIYVSTYPARYFNYMTLQKEIPDAFNPVLIATDIYCPTTANNASYIDLDIEIEWESDSYFTPLTIFMPVFPEGTNAPINTAYLPSEIVDVNSVELERSVVFATRENGMWRYNGSQFINMRIPRPPSGIIRNIRGTNGQLKIDTADDGFQSGRIYEFIVSYSYTELVNGKLVTYESGLSPVGGYTITSAPALDGSGQSQLVELLVPTLPLGIGLPVTAMTINVYRTLSGRLATEATSETYLLERQVANNPYVPYLAILAGTEAKLQFNETNYKILYASVQTDVTNDELAREIIDPPLASIVTSLENRVIAANGGEQPYVNLIGKDVFNTSDGSFSANGIIRYSPPNTPQAASYAFVGIPLTPVTTSGTVADETGTRNFQMFAPAGVYSIGSIAHTDTSNVFRIAGAAVYVLGAKYLLRFALGAKEGLVSGGKDPYYDGFGFETQTFVCTNVANREVEGQKKWVSKDAGGAVITPAETFVVFEESLTVENISNTNGLIITGTSGDSTTASDVAKFTLKLTTTVTNYAVGDKLILKGLGTTGQVKDADGNILNFDTQIICEVLTKTADPGPWTYTLAIDVMSNTAAGATAYKQVKVSSAISVSNLGGGVFSTPFIIYKSKETATLTTFTLPSAIATFTMTAAPALTIPAGTYIVVDGLPLDLPRGSNCNWNRTYQTVAPNYAAGVFTVTCPLLPEEVRGSVGQTFGSNYGKLSVPKDIFSYGTPIGGINYLQVLLTSQVLTVPVAAGDWVYMIVRGKENDSIHPALTGWFKVVRVRNNVPAWVTSLAIGAAMTGVEFEIPCPTASLPALDFSGMTGVSETKLCFLNQSAPAVALQKYIPVPMPYILRDDPFLSDLTGTMYGPTDGYTPLEKVIKRYAHAFNFVLHNQVFAYWGGKRIANDESSSPGNVLPTNGCKIIPHLYPVDKQFYRYVTTTIPSADREASWTLFSAAAHFRIEGATRSDGLGATTAVSTVSAKETRPSRIWYTNPTGTLIGQAFRELSFDEVESQDGESVTAMSPMQTFGLLFKNSSAWNITFNNGAVFTKTRIPSIIGASSAKNVVPTPKGAFVLHDSGVYITDGGTMEDVLQPSRVFRDRVSQNIGILKYAAGFHNPFTKTVYLGVPLSSQRGPAVSEISGQLVFNYSNRSITLYSVDTGWSVNTQMPATFWTRILSDAYFASTFGKVFRLRRERTKTMYSDERTAIPFMVRTRYIFSQVGAMYVDSQGPIGARFYRSLFFQFGTETRNTMEVALTKDFGTTYTHISSFSVDTSDPLNAVGAVALDPAYIEAMRRTPPTPRATNLSIMVTNNEIDTAAELHGIFLESSDGTTKLIPQPAT